MPENAPESAAVAAASTSSLTRAQKRLVLLLAFLFSAVPFFFVGDMAVRGFRLNDLDASAFFFSLGILPGALGIVYHLLLANTRRAQARELRDQYYAFRAARRHARPQDRGPAPAEEGSADPTGAIAASLFLTGIFLLIAVFAGYEASEQRGAAANGVQGMMYAGLGAYVAVLYYMVARLYANALSCRFLMTSALRTASAVALGWVLGIVGVTAFAGVPAAAAEATSSTALGSNAVLFLVGLFHNMAIDSLRRRARRLFGGAEAPEEVPLTTIEGIDETTAELLSEHGVASIQHLATADPGELCDRTDVPLDRLVDWIDQALLIRCLGRGVVASRTLGIRTASDLAVVHIRGDGALLTSLAEKTAVPPAAIDHIARELRGDYTLGLIYELRQGRELESAAAQAPATVAPSPVIPIRSEASASPPALQP